jgi:hypothetical protein
LQELGQLFRRDRTAAGLFGLVGQSRQQFIVGRGVAKFRIPVENLKTGLRLAERTTGSRPIRGRRSRWKGGSASSKRSAAM